MFSMPGLTFINYNKTDRDPIKNRNSINSHVSRVAHHRRQRNELAAAEEVSDALERVKFFSERWVSGRLLLCHRCGGPLAHCRRQCAALRDGVATKKTAASLSSTGWQQAASASLSRQESATVSPGPATILAKGNSDPFNSFEIRIDAQVAYLLAFANECFIPSIIYRGRINLPDRARSLTKNLPATPFGLNEDICQGFATLSRYAAITASATVANDDMVRTAIVFKIRASKVLRSNLAQFSELQNEKPDSASVLRESICWSVHLLAAAELEARNYSAAVMHGKMLRQLIQPQDPSQRVQFEFSRLTSILYIDTMRAAVSLTRSSFDLDRWEETHCPKEWTDPQGHQHPVPSLASLKSEDCNPRDLCITLQRGIAVYSASPTHTFIHRCINYIAEARLVNAYLDAPPAESLDSPQATYLACLYWLRRAVRTESFGIGSELARTGSTLYDAGPVILRELSLIASRESAADFSPHDMYGTGSLPRHTSTLRLWIFYIGALIEHAPHARATGLGTFFQLGFVRQAQAIGYYSWSAVRSLFLAHDFLCEEEIWICRSDDWFEQALATPSFGILPQTTPTASDDASSTAIVQSTPRYQNGLLTPDQGTPALMIATPVNSIGLPTPYHTPRTDAQALAVRRRSDAWG